MDRMMATAAYLRSHDLLGPDASVIDIGCGPGRFASEFARTAGRVVGVDISPRTVEYARRFCAEAGHVNTTFLAEDFLTLDIESAGFSGAFDLAFSSITPAVRSAAGLEKFMALSRAHCFLSYFIRSYNELHEQIAADLFQRPVFRRRDGRLFYTVFNTLFLNGYQPLTHYYTQIKEKNIAVDREEAEDCAETILPQEDLNDENIERIYEWLKSRADGDGRIVEKSAFSYGWLLWDLRDRGEARHFNAL